MKEYIEREAAIEKTEAFCDTFVTHWTDEKVLAWIKYLPAADVVERKRGEWISVEERLPEGNDLVLVYYKEPYYDNVGCICLIRWDNTSVICRNTTHWMPAPEPPEEV